MEPRNSRLFLLLIYFALSIYLQPTLPQGVSPNELARWATAVSLVEKTSFDIGWTENIIGKDVETVNVGEKVYSINAPGTALLAAPVYALVRTFTGPPNSENIGVSWFAMRLLTSTLPMFFLAIWLYQKDVDFFSLATFLFATPMFIYGLLFNSHVLVAVLVYLVFRLLYDTRQPALRHIFAAGLLSGFAVISEFVVTIPVLIFTLGLFFTDHRDRYRRLFFYLSGIIPWLVFLVIYNNAIFGSLLPIHFWNTSFADITVPSLSNIFLLLFSPSRGLFFFSPVLLFSIIAVFTSRELGTLRKRVKILTVIVSILIFCGVSYGGWGFGASHLIFIIPLMLDSFFDGDVEDYPTVWRAFMFTGSFFLCVLPVLTLPFAPTEFRFPHNSFWRPILVDNQWFTPTLLTYAGYPATVWTAIPAIVLFLLVVYLLWRNSKYPLASMIGILSACLAIGIYFFVPGLVNDAERSRRSATAEQLFKNR